MRKILLFALLAILTSCQKVIVEEHQQASKTKEFTFHLKGDFKTNYEDMSRASVRLEDNNAAGITDIWALDYVGGTLVQQIHQSSKDADFGSVPMSLTYGHHDIKFVASKGTSPALTVSALSWSKVLDTFTLDYPVDVVASSNGNRAPELKRAVGGVRVVATDKVTSGTQNIYVVMKRSMALELPTLAAEDVLESENNFNILSSQWDKTGLSLTTYTLCPEEEMTTDVMVTVTGDDDAIISQFTVSNVSVKKNRITTLTGEVFGRGSGFSVAIDDSWDEGLDVIF